MRNIGKIIFKILVQKFKLDKNKNFDEKSIINQNYIINCKNSANFARLKFFMNFKFSGLMKFVDYFCIF